VRHWGVIRGEGLYFDSKFFYLVRCLSHSSLFRPPGFKLMLILRPFFTPRFSRSKSFTVPPGLPPLPERPPHLSTALFPQLSPLPRPTPHPTPCPPRPTARPPTTPLRLRRRSSDRARPTWNDEEAVIFSSALRLTSGSPRTRRR
jgi:hypothetical protein